MQALADVECLVGPSASMGIEEIALQFYLDRYLENTDFVNFRHILNLPGLLPGAFRNYKRKLAIEEFVREGRYYFPKPVTGEEECAVDPAMRDRCFLGQFKLVCQIRLSETATLTVSR